MRIAVTYENENIFQHFGHTEQFKIYDIEEDNIKKQELIEVKEHGHGALVELLSNHSVDVLICGGIGSGAKDALEKSNIKLYAGVSGKADSAVNDLLNQKLNYNENAHCEHHESSDHTCGEDKHGCSGN